MNETELQAQIKRMQSEMTQLQQQFQMLQGGYFSVGTTFRAVVQDLLVAIGDPDDKQEMESAKKHAKEIVKQWDMSLEMRAKAEAERATKANNIIQLPEKDIISPS